MKRIISIILALVMLGSTAVLPALASDNASYVYVAVTGSDDTGDGTQANPYATIAKARQHIADNGLSRLYPIYVMIGAGTYSADTPVTFSGNSSSGGTSAKIYYKANGDVTFTSAKTVNASDFTLVTDSTVLADIQSQVRGKVYSLDLAKYGITATEADLFIDDVKMTVSRYPNSGYLSSTSSTTTVSVGRAANWNNTENAIVKGSFDATYSWSTASITETTDTSMVLSEASRKNMEWYVENLLEEIDYVGEYCVLNNVLYCYLPTGYENAEIQVLADDENDAFIDIKANIYSLAFEGIKFDKIASTAIKASGGGVHDITVNNCEFNYIKAPVAVYVAGTNMTVSNNTAYGCDGAFVTFSGGEEGNVSQGIEMTASNNLIENNYIANCGEIGRGSYVIGCTSYNSPSSYDGISAVGATVRNNVISNCAVTNAITVPGVNIKVQYNELYNTGRHISDGGAIYLGRSNTKYGNEISYNYIHHLYSESNIGAHMFSGLYADDGYGGVKMNYNVFYDMSHGIHIGMGMNNEFNNNLFVNMRGSKSGGKGGIFSQTRMTSGSTYSTPEETNAMTADSAEQKSTFYYETNYAVNNYGTLYNTTFSDLAAAVKRTPFFAPWNSVVTGNVAFKTGTSSNGNAIGSRATHSKTATTHNISTNEADLIAANPNAVSGTTVYEMALYGKKVVDANGNDLNETTAGNPTYTYDDSYFVDAANQNFTLVDSFASDVSDVESIDMTLMGLSDTSVTPANAASLKAFADQENGNVIVSWERPKTASRYTVKLSASADMTNAQTVEVYDNNFENAYVFEGLSENTTYYAQVTAEGIARQNQYSVTSDVVSVTTSASIETAGLKTAVEMLEEEVRYAAAGTYDYTDTTLKAEMTAALEAAKAVLTSPASQEAVSEQEMAVYALLERANSTRVIKAQMSITKCTPVDNSTMVEVTASGFEANASVSILVTNPKSTLSDLTDTNEEIVRYANIEVANKSGQITFSFDTSVKDVDMPGEYKVYLSGSDGLMGEASYIYGTVETGAVSYKDADGNAVEAEDLVNCKGKTVTAVIDVTSRLNSDITPAAVCGIYEGSKILSVDAKKVSLSKNSVNSVELTITIPQTYTENSEVELMLFDSESLIKPLTTKRIMVEK